MAADRRILIVGFGLRGRQWQRACARRRGAAVAGVVDPDPEAARAASALGLRSWPRLEDALGAAGADAAIVASPPSAHAGDALSALGAGLDVLVEKPLALSAADAARVAAAADGGRLALVGQNLRLLPRERAIRAALADGRLGRPRESTVVACRPAGPGRGGSDGAERELWDIAVHHLDIARLRAGSAPSVVRATQTEGDLLVCADWADGFRLRYRQGLAAPVFHHVEWLACERGGLAVSGRRVELILPGRRPLRLRAAGRWDAERRLLDVLLDGDAAARRAFSAHDNLATVASVEAAARSLRLGREVSLREVGSTREERRDG